MDDENIRKEITERLMRNLPTWLEILRDKINKDKNNA
jgi:hypothetical protein